MIIFLADVRLGKQIFQYFFLKTIRKNNEKIIVYGFEDLKEVFEKERLEDLRNLEFDIPSYEVELPEEEYTLNSIEDNEQRETDRLVSEGANKG